MEVLACFELVELSEEILVFLDGLSGLEDHLVDVGGGGMGVGTGGGGFVGQRLRCGKLRTRRRKGDSH